MKDVTHILERVEPGDPAAADELLPLVYGELRKRAVSKMRAPALLRREQRWVRSSN